MHWRCFQWEDNKQYPEDLLTDTVQALNFISTGSIKQYKPTQQLQYIKIDAGGIKQANLDEDTIQSQF